MCMYVFIHEYIYAHLYDCVYVCISYERLDVEVYAHVEGSTQLESQGQLKVNAREDRQGQPMIKAQYEDGYLPITTYPFEIPKDIHWEGHVQSLNLECHTSHHTKSKSEL